MIDNQPNSKYLLSDLSAPETTTVVTSTAKASTLVSTLATTATMETVPTDTCLSQPCLNYGTCIGGNIGYVCLCVEQYTGPNCDVKMEPATSKICSYQHMHDY